MDINRKNGLMIEIFYNEIAGIGIDRVIGFHYPYSQNKTKTFWPTKPLEAPLSY
ncbi:hypothetical protein NST62_00265 [Ureibacillus sp. FSL K6-8385]|uniref:hypothetical protein n=1 Tax=Ureibacillus TaxID=160795 RepID=UPI0015EEDA14|nr:hypothetical protein [Ureibacillus terrenus]MED3662161.1 hypothetical protein [Ureibacillus terrenus]MED3764425.1 hypothetical protein [Ureibacillus terrenus]